MAIWKRWPAVAFKHSPVRDRVLATALAQSDKVRRLSQQLFELAALQSVSQVLHRERFRLDELVVDAVQKFELVDRPAPVTLDGASPGRLELDGDGSSSNERSPNSIDNAIQHAPGAAPVRVSVRQDGAQVKILVEDAGPGLPAELARRWSKANPRIRRSSGSAAASADWGLPLPRGWRCCMAARCARCLRRGRHASCLALPLAA